MKMNTTTFIEKKELITDLHMHTIASDGTWTPSILVSHLLSAGIGIFSITDHDSTESHEEAETLASDSNLLFIPGVEISSTFSDHTYHILGYGFNRKNSALQALLAANRKHLEDKDYEIIERASLQYSAVSVSDFSNYTNNPTRGGWKALNYLIDRGICENYKDFFSKFEENASTTDRPIFADPKMVIHTLHEAGGWAVLAHPGAGFYDPNYKQVIAALHAFGLDGVECHHPENSPEITQFCLSYCTEHQLMITCGSDCHGDFVRTRRLGYPCVPLKELQIDKLL